MSPPRIQAPGSLPSSVYCSITEESGEARDFGEDLPLLEEGSLCVPWFMPVSAHLCHLS